MDFYQAQQQRIAQDQQDNALIETLTKNYVALNQKYEASCQENIAITQQLSQLKAHNEHLQQEIQELKAANKVKDNHSTQLQAENHTNTFYRSANNLTPIAFRTMDRSMCSQLTKRRVINSFAEELSLQLEQSESTLAKQRRMHEQTRRALQICNQQMSILKIKGKELDNRVLDLTIENQKLLRELEEAIRSRRELQERFCVNAMQKRKKSAEYLLNLQEFEEEMNKMDSIYQSIEYELSLKT